MLSVTLLAAASCPRPHAGHMLTTCWSHADHMLVSCRPPPRHMRHMLHHRPALARALLAHTKHAHSKPYARRLHKTRHSIASHKCAHSKAYMRFSPARPAQPPHMSRTQQRNSAPCKLTPPITHPNSHKQRERHTHLLEILNHVVADADGLDLALCLQGLELLIGEHVLPRHGPVHEIQVEVVCRYPRP